MLDVVHVQGQALLPGQGVAAVHGGVSGDARLYRQLQALFAFVELGFATQVGPGAHHRHVAEQHVEELRHLIQAGLAHEGADLGHAGVIGAVVGAAVLHDQVGGVHAHAAQLVHLEVHAILSHARRVVEHRAAVFQLDKGRQHRDDEQHEGQRDQPDGDVPDSFSEAYVHQRAPSAFACEMAWRRQRHTSSMSSSESLV